MVGYIALDIQIWLVVETPIWKICGSQIDSISPGIGVKIKNIWNHHLEIHSQEVFIFGMFLGFKYILRRWPWMSRVGDWDTTQLYGDYFINHDIRIPSLNNQDSMERIRPGFFSWLNMESFFDGYITSRTYWVDKFIPLIKQPCIRPFFLVAHQVVGSQS